MYGMLSRCIILDNPIVLPSPSSLLPSGGSEVLAELVTK